MQLVNEFVVPRDIDGTWALLTDVERLAPAMPGAQIDEVVDGAYHGTVKVKVGPVSAQYKGTATFRELDAVSRHMVLDATGKEASGRGRAAAVVTADLIAEGAETRVTVTTDLTLSGPLAQFGRGAIAEVSTKLLNQFVERLRADLAAVPAAATETDIPDGIEPGPAEASPPASTSGVDTGLPRTALPRTVAPPAAPEVNLVGVAAWPILKRLLPVLAGVAVVVLLLVWWLG